jgi:uncharacterized protein
MSRLTVSFHQYAAKRRFLFSLILIVVIIFSVHRVTRIQLKEDISAIIPRDERLREINSLISGTGFADRVIVTFSLKDQMSQNPDMLIEAAEKFYTGLSKDTGLVSTIQFKSDQEEFLQVYDFMYDHLPLYLDEDDYYRMELFLSPDEMDKTMAANLRSLSSLTGLFTKDFILKDPLSITPLALRKLETFQLDENFIIHRGCVFTQDMKHLLVFVDPVYPASNTKANSKLIELIDYVVTHVSESLSQVNVEYYGGTVVAVENAEAIKGDILLTVSFAVFLLFILFLFIFKKLKYILLIFFPIMLGILFAITILVISGISISAISLGIGAILIGISLDYSLHAFTHYRNEGSMTHALRSITIPVLMSSLTTASAFLCLFIVRSEALNQLGMFSALAIFITALTVLFVLPVFFRYRNSKDNEVFQKRKTILDKIASVQYDRNRYLILIIIVLTIVFSFTSRKLGFNSDLNSLNYMSDELKHAEMNLRSISTQASSAVYFIVKGDSYDDVIVKAEKNEKFLEEALSDGIMNGYSSPVSLILSKEMQQKKINRWHEFWNHQDREIVMSGINEAAEKYHFRPDAFQQFQSLLFQDFDLLEYEDFQLLTNGFLSGYLNHNDSNYTALFIIKTNQQNKNKLFEYFASNDDFMIVDNQHFTNQFLEVLQEDFNLLVILSVIIVFAILLIFFGRIELALITFLPVMISWLWTIGIMGLLGITFNIFNIIISTFILGLGVDYSIFVMNGLLKNYKFGSKSLVPYKLSVLLSALTTIIALGVLIFARHPALKSIAVVSIVGIVSVIVITYTLLPLMFRFITMYNGNKRNRPVVFSDLIISVATVLIYFFGSLGVTVLLPLIHILPLKRKTRRYIVHVLICFTSKFIVLVNITIRKKYRELKKLDFSTPVVLVSNHQSHLDLVLILLLNPKIMAFTNRWVWYSPFYGFIIRYAGFYPAFRGVEHDLKKVEKKIGEGYSVLIFPEGTRTTDGNISRMHQGALYIAGKFNLDIQPLILHGVNHIMEKNEFFMRSGKMTMNVYDRIKVKPADTENNETYRLQAKQLTKFYREEFEKLRLSLETPAYFRRKLISQYIYKGPVLEWYLKIKLKLEKNYELFNSLIPRNCSVMDIGCGFGFLSYMLTFVSPQRKVTGIDYDERKIMVAANCPSKSDNQTFICADVLDVDFGQYDVFVLSDVLHYFNEEKQEKLIRKCIEHLKPGGMMIIRDADSSKKSRHLGTRYTEFFSTRSGFNKMGEGRLFFTSAQKIQSIVSDNGLTLEIIDNTRLTSNVVFVIRKPILHENGKI